MLVRSLTYVAIAEGSFASLGKMIHMFRWWYILWDWCHEVQMCTYVKTLLLIAVFWCHMGTFSWSRLDPDKTLLHCHWIVIRPSQDLDNQNACNLIWLVNCNLADISSIRISLDYAAMAVLYDLRNTSRLSLIVIKSVHPTRLHAPVWQN